MRLHTQPHGPLLAAFSTAQTSAWHAGAAGPFTIDTLPNHVPCFAPDSDTLGEYCAALAQVLLCRSVPPQQEEPLRWLLADLMAYLAEEINAPRWIRTEEGVRVIDNVTG